MLTRRRFVQWIGAAGTLTATGCATPRSAGDGSGRAGKPLGRVVVVGGGFGGASCARYLRRWAPEVSVTLIEPNAQYVTCPFSNAVIGGLREMDSITHGYDGLRRAGVNILTDWVKGVDPVRREVQLNGGAVVAYDRLVMAPGIDLRYDALPGYDAAAAEVLPHAWKAGEQTRLLRRQIQAMPDGGAVIISVPGNPYRCPPGPYERAGLIANYLRKNKPKSKVIILDSKDNFPKQELFIEGWNRLYPGYVEWIKGSEGGRVQRVDPKTRTLDVGFGFAPRKGDVVNIIPPQRAAAVAVNAGLADNTGWCPVNPRTFESSLQPAIHVIGDACTVGPLPKSAYAANSEAKVCAMAVASALTGGVVPDPTLLNTCYSLLAEDYGISVAGVFKVRGNEMVAVEGSGGVSPLQQPLEFRKKEADFARSWYQAIIADTFS